MKMHTLAQDTLSFAPCREGAVIPSMQLAVQDASNKTLVEYVGRLLADENLLAEAARRSYRHQLGFWKCVLMSDDAGQCLRLHFWDRSVIVLEDIHSHCASFQSRVVFGSLVENSFVAVSGESHVRFRYRFDSSEGHSVAAVEGLTAVRLCESRALSIGDSYSKFAEDLHSVSDVKTGTVTISFWGARDSDAFVLKAPNSRAEDCAASMGMSPGLLGSLLREILERFGST